MKDKLLTYAIGISVVVHLVGVCVVARTSASRLSAAPEKPQQQRLVKVDLVSTPDEAAKPKPEPVVTKPLPAPKPEPRVNEPKPVRHEQPAYTPEPPRRTSHSQPRPVPQAPRDVKPTKNTTQPAGNPGGKLNVGSTSARGDLGGNWSGGKTPVGWVPGSDNGRGKGSGSGVGVGTPDPPKHADDGPGTRPAPRQDPPSPRMVSVRVCNESGLLPNKYCDRTHTESFVDGSEPSRTCSSCKAPEPKPEPKHVSTLADRAEPVPTKRVKPSIPSSVPEGKRLTATVEFTVTENGDVADIKLVKSSGYKALDSAVVSAQSKWKYKPAVQNGVPRSRRISQPYEFDS